MNKVDKYVRTDIKKYTKDDVYIEPRYLNKYVCQVFINCLHPEYEKRLVNNQDTFVCLIIGNTWEEVNNKFCEMNKEK